MGVIRRILFWLHLSAGVVAGLVILSMSATGVALTYERQLVEWSTRQLRSLAPTPASERLSAERLLEQVRRDHPTADLSGLTLAARSDAPVVVAASPAPILVDAYSGHTLGERQTEGVRAFMSRMRAWHRWLAIEGNGRPIARAITGWSNLLFLYIVVSGIWIWVPRTQTWNQFKSVLFFRRQYSTSKARDYNWHNVIGVWSALPLFVVVLSAVPISFPWANNLIYRAVGEAPPARRVSGPPAREGQDARSGDRRGPGTRDAQGTSPDDRSARSEGRDGGRGGRLSGRPRDDQSGPLDVSGLDLALSRAGTELPGWRTITVRFPQTPTHPFALNVDRGDGGQPHLRATLVVDRTGSIVERETFADQSLGRQIRGVMRFAHTGEVLGLAGQTVAGLASAAAVVMVWTGLALTCRRFLAWLARRRANAPDTTTADAFQHTPPEPPVRTAIPGLAESSSRQLVS